MLGVLCMWTIIVTLIPIIITLLTFIFNQFFTKELRQGIKELHNIQREANQKNILCNGDFFRNILSAKGKIGAINVFCDSLPSKDKTKNHGRIKIKKEINRSYLLTGESGCGKSSFLKQDYIQHSYSLINRKFPFIHPINYLFSFSLYLTAIDLLELDEEKICVLKDKLEKLPITHTRLYLDGLDEMGEQFKSKKVIIEKLIQTMKLVPKCEVKIACRYNFLNKNNCKSFFSQGLFSSGYDYLEIDYWDSIALEDIAKKVLSNMNLKKALKNQPNDIVKKSKNWNRKFHKELRKKQKNVFKDAATFDKCLINSPLILMLFLYTNLFTSSEIIISNKNSKYELYDLFINAIGYTDGANKENIDKEKKILSKLAFDHFIKLNTSDFKRIKSIDTPDWNNLQYLRKLIKNPIYTGSEISFIHYSFLDFFIAFQYQLVLIDTNTKKSDYINVLGADYQNNIADFITDALQIYRPNDEIAKNMCNIYNSLIKNRKQTIRSFLAKNEIAFRLGRLWYSSKEVRNEISSFLKNIYYQDNYTFNDDKESEIHLAMLKRWIAIAGSLLHTKDGEEIELDYIKKMICFTYKDHNIADEAHRSQTLCFYGDVNGVSALDYRDINPETECNISIKKPINRLVSINNKESISLLKKNLNPRDSDLKIYCSRAFDLASIYCLLRFHGGKNELFINGLKQANNCKIDNITVNFENANPEREKIMKLLLNALKQPVLPDKIIINDVLSIN